MARTRRRKKSSSNSKGSAAEVMKVDFRKEEGQWGGGIRIPENDYKAKVVKVKKGKSSEKETPGIFITFKITEGKYKGKEIGDRLWTTPKSLPRLRAFLECLGVNVPKKVVALPLKQLVGKELGITVTDDEYEGRIRSQVSDFLDLETFEELDSEDEDEDDEDLEDEDDEDLDDEDEEDEEDEEEDEDEDEEDEDEEDEDDMDDLDLDSL